MDHSNYSKAPMEFNPTPIKCNKCGDIIKSKFPGHFVTCKCGAVSVDQTEYYSRCLGNPEDYTHVPVN